MRNTSSGLRLRVMCADAGFHADKTRRPVTSRVATLAGSPAMPRVHAAYRGIMTVPTPNAEQILRRPRLFSFLKATWDFTFRLRREKRLALISDRRLPRRCRGDWRNYFFIFSRNFSQAAIPARAAFSSTP